MSSSAFISKQINENRVKPNYEKKHLKQDNSLSFRSTSFVERYRYNILPPFSSNVEKNNKFPLRSSRLDSNNDSSNTSESNISNTSGATTTTTTTTTATSSPENINNIVILGGGFGGLNAALNLASIPSSSNTYKIQIVDRKERFVFLPLLYELCVGDATLEEVCPTFKSLLQGIDNVEFIQAEIKGVDANNNLVYLNQMCDDSSTSTLAPTTTTKLTYDALIIATGMESNLDSVPGATDMALPFYTMEDCYELRKRLTLLKNIEKDNSKVEAVIVGGGYSGVELALNLMERLGGKDKAVVTLVHRGSTLLEGATDFNRNASISRLEKAGIRMLTNTSVEKIELISDDEKIGRYDCTIQIRSKKLNMIDDDDNESFLNANVLLWTAGARPPPNTGALNSIFPRDTSNRIVTNNSLQVKNSSNVYCIGDAARGKKEPYPGTAQVAIQQAPVVAWNVISTLQNNDKNSSEKLKLLPFRYLDLGNMMTLGSNDASITSLGGLVTLDGPAASLARRLIYAVRMPTLNQAATAAVLSTSQKVSTTIAEKLVRKESKK